MVEVKYTSPALPPNNLKVDARYAVGKDSKGYYITVNNGSLYMDFEEIQSLFSPVDGSWDALISKPEKKVSKIKY